MRKNKTGEPKAKKPIYKRVWFWILIAFCLFIYIGSSNAPDSTEDVNTPPTVETSTNSEVSVTEPEVEVEASSTTETPSEEISAVPAFISTTSAVIEMSYPDNEYKVYEQDGCIYVDIWQPNLANDLSTLILANQPDAWKSLIDATCYASEESQKLADTMGVNMGVIYTWYDVVNGADTPFLVCSRGDVIFDMWEAVSKQLQ